LRSGQTNRDYKFVEFFAGMGGLSRVVGELDGVQVLAVLDGYDGEWNIHDDDHFSKAIKLCEVADLAHFAPMCRTFTMARREDEFGKVRELRSMQYPEGWGDPEADEHNAMVVRMVALCLVMERRRQTWAIENPWESYIWLLAVMQKLIKAKGADLVLLHQCAYGAPTMKPTGLLTTSRWMKEVRLLCDQVRSHHHLKNGLVGRVFDYASNREVWRTALASEYPQGLCIAWAQSLNAWLASEEGQNFLDEDRLVKVGKWKNVLVKKRKLLEDQEGVKEKEMSERQRRESENELALDGLRNARKAVMTSKQLREVGWKVRQIIDQHFDEEVVIEFEKDATQGLPTKWCEEVQRHLKKAFGATEERTVEGIETSLWEALLQEAGDVDREVVPGWLRNGFPLGIEDEIEFTGVFARTDADTDAVLASREEGMFLADDEGLLTNYASFQEAGPLAQEVVDKMVQQERLEQFDTWNEVQSHFAKARLSRMACIVKERSDKSLKVRLVIDTRRSGVNGLATIRERVILPRVADVAASWKRLRQSGLEEAEAEMLSADFSEAFNTLNLMEAERGFLVIKGLTGKYYVSRVVLFGAAAGPLLWCRLIASAMRLTQALSVKGESEVSTFVDDPVIVAVAKEKRERSWIVVRSLVFWLSLGLKLSWSKAQRGTSLVWIGFELTLVFV